MNKRNRAKANYYDKFLLNAVKAAGRCRFLIDEENKVSSLSPIKKSKMDNMLHISKIKKFINAGANINAVDSKGNNVLHILMGYSEHWIGLDVLDFLIDEGADLNALNKNGQTPLNIAVKCLNVKFAKTLIETDMVNINEVDKDNNSLLMQVNNISNKSIEWLFKHVHYLKSSNPQHMNKYNMSKMLIEEGIDIDIEDNLGKSIIDYYYHVPSKDLEKALMDSNVISDNTLLN